MAGLTATVCTVRATSSNLALIRMLAARAASGLISSLILPRLDVEADDAALAGEVVQRR